MATQDEVEAAAKYFNRKLDEFVPSLFRARITGQMSFDLCLGILEEAEKVRKKKK